MIYQSLPIIASIIEDNACAVNHETWTWYLPSHLVYVKILCSRCEPSTNYYVPYIYFRSKDSNMVCVMTTESSRNKDTPKVIWRQYTPVLSSSVPHLAWFWVVGTRSMAVRGELSREWRNPPLPWRRMRKGNSRFSRGKGAGMWFHVWKSCHWYSAISHISLGRWRRELGLQSPIPWRRRRGKPCPKLQFSLPDNHLQ